MSDFDTYYALNPVSVWDRQTWTEYDPVIAVNFYQNAMFTPLVMWQPLDPKASTFVTGREALPGHINHNTIGVRQNYMTAQYVDSRERHIVANSRYGGKIQLHKHDELIEQWKANGRDGFARGVLQQHLNQSILGTHEMLARDALINNCNVKTYAGGATDFDSINATDPFRFDIKQLRDVKLRLAVRSRFALQQFGDYARPVPGNNDLLIMTTPMVMYDLWDQMDGEWMMNLRDLQDERIINGGQVRYQGFTFVESMDAVLWNAGSLTTQVGITQPITAGDGTVDPDSATVAGVWYTGQSSAGITHYVQCSDFGASDFVVGDFVSLHVDRSTADGVTNGVDYMDGKTMVMEVQALDAGNNRLTFMTPVMDDYNESFIGTPDGGSSATLYGYVTKAQHVHPVYLIAARGGSLFAIRDKVNLHTPAPVDDFESVYRSSWDEEGGMNAWNQDLHEISFCAASFGNRGTVAIA